MRHKPYKVAVLVEESSAGVPVLHGKGEVKIYKEAGEVTLQDSAEKATMARYFWPHGLGAEKGVFDRRRNVQRGEVLLVLETQPGDVVTPVGKVQEGRQVVYGDVKKCALALENVPGR